MSLDGQHFEVVIIGAGMAGVAAGIRLALFDKKVIILERHNAAGGLNSFYSINGRKFDVGLHAMTNYVKPGVKGTPLTKLLRQLRIPRDAFDLSEQIGSRIAFPGVDLRFSNEFSFFESEVARAFPDEIDNFRKFVEAIKAFDEVNLANKEQSARAILTEFLTNPLLVDMLMAPVMYYGSAQENDMDWSQFVIMFKSLFFEGFARPYAGVRQIIRALLDKYRELGGVRKMKCGVQEISAENGRVTAIRLDSGETITADQVISTAGLPETLRMCSDLPKDAGQEYIGQLSFAETITVLNEQPKNIGWNDTIVFFNDTERFEYKRPDSLLDIRSGVLCIPNNYAYAEGQELDEGILRMTAMANYDQWVGLPEERYLEEKALGYAVLTKRALEILPCQVSQEKLKELTIATDMFTPRTVKKYTGHLAGAIYGSSKKIRQGTTHLENLYIAGTDQGFLGIVGAMLSGISMANLHVLQGN